MVDYDSVVCYCCRVMVTPNTVTKRKSPQFRTFQTWPVERGSLREDADIAAFALNASRGTAAYNRLTSLHHDLQKLWVETAEPRQVRRIKEINHRLTRYVFHPTVTLGSREERFGVIALSDSSFLPAPENQIAVTEADAALSLVRLHAMGDLRKVRLCEVCRKRWLAASHSNYRFCSKQCREEFFQSQPDYHKRKAGNQRRYRENLKRMHDGPRCCTQRAGRHYTEKGR